MREGANIYRQQAEENVGTKGEAQAATVHHADQVNRMLEYYRPEYLWEIPVIVNSQNTNIPLDVSKLDLRNSLIGGGKDMRRWNFAWANLQGVNFHREPNLTDAIFSDADLTDVSFAGANLTKASFRGEATKIVRTDFSQTDCTGADFGGLDLTNASFDARTILENARLDGITVELWQLSQEGYLAIPRTAQFEKISIRVDNVGLSLLDSKRYKILGNLQEGETISLSRKTFFAAFPGPSRKS